MGPWGSRREARRWGVSRRRTNCATGSSENICGEREKEGSADPKAGERCVKEEGKGERAKNTPKSELLPTNNNPRGERELWGGGLGERVEKEPCRVLHYALEC